MSIRPRGHTVSKSYLAGARVLGQVDRGYPPRTKSTPCGKGEDYRKMMEWEESSSSSSSSSSERALN